MQYKINGDEILLEKEGRTMTVAVWNEGIRVHGRTINRREVFVALVEAYYAAR